MPAGNKDDELTKLKDNGEGDELTADVTLSDGTIVSKDGAITFPSGRKATLADGSAIQMNGKMQGSDSLIPDEATAKGFQKKDAKMVMVMKDGKLASMDTSMRLENGTTVETDGTISARDGALDTLRGVDDSYRRQPEEVASG